MASNNNDNDSRRNRPDPEDNPFIAFRRFADSQVSSLLNTVFTLPVTLATLNNAHHAREQCLFGQAGSSQCEKLRELEDEVAQIRSEGRELYRTGDVQTMLKKGEELMKLDRQADELRKHIVEGARGRESVQDKERTQTELVERVGNEKGQHWGWSWSWGFPASFDEEEHARSNEDRQVHRRMCRRQQRRLDDSQQIEAEDDWQRPRDRWLNIKERMNEELPQSEPNKRTWAFPPPADSSRPGNPANERVPTLFDELGNMIMDEVTKLMLPRSFSYHNEEYSPRVLEDNEELRKAGVPWRDAYEDLVRSERGVGLLPPAEIGQSRGMTHDQWTRRFWDPEYAHPESSRRFPVGTHYPKVVPWEGEETSEEPSYEYAHDHEDQHDEPPSPKSRQGPYEGKPATEMEAYERLLGSASSTTESTSPVGPMSTTEPTHATRMSVLSTLTTTERTVSPDGTTTTKVVLKKRFADGREESSETIHSQRGQEADSQQDRWTALQDVRRSSPFNSSVPLQESAKKDSKKGWFWSN